MNVLHSLPQALGHGMQYVQIPWRLGVLGEITHFTFIGIVLLHPLEGRHASLDTWCFSLAAGVLGEGREVAYNISMLTYISALVILALVLVGQIYGIHGFYFKIPLYDVPMHLLGGFGIGLFISAIIQSLPYGARHPRVAALLWVIMIGLTWELFELYFNLSGYAFGTHLYLVDTAKDLANDTLGGIAAIFITMRSRRRS